MGLILKTLGFVSLCDNHYYWDLAICGMNLNLDKNYHFIFFYLLFDLLAFQAHGWYTYTHITKSLFNQFCFCTNFRSAIIGTVLEFKMSIVGFMRRY